MRFWTTAILGFAVLVAEIVGDLMVARLMMQLPIERRGSTDLILGVLLLLASVTVALYFALLTWSDR